MKILGALLDLPSWIGSAIYCPENLSCMKFIETHTCTFLALIISSISSVHLAGFEDDALFMNYDLI